MCHVNFYFAVPLLYRTRAGKNDIDAIPISAEAYRRGKVSGYEFMLGEDYEGTVT